MSQTQPEPLPIQDNAHVYGLITRLLHWAIAALISWQFLCMIIKIIFGKQDFVKPFVMSHQPVGLVLAALILIRVVWALVNKNNRPDHGVGLVATAAKFGHVALYVLMIAIPALAILRGWGGDRPFMPFGLPINPGRPEAIGWARAIGSAHGLLAWLLGLLVLGHVFMVLVHERVWRDGTMSRMAGKKR